MSEGSKVAVVTGASQGLGEGIAKAFRAHQYILGIFDEGCMGMYNAIIPDELLHPTGLFKERLSQSSLFAAMREVTDAEGEEYLVKRHGWRRLLRS